MLIEFFGENFGCFRDEFRLSMLATDIDPDSTRGIIEAEVNGDPEPLRLLRAVALYGANASGKTTVLRAARALRHLIRASGRFRSDDLVPVYEPFAGGNFAKQPVRLGLRAIVESEVYDYEVHYDREQILFERLDHNRIDGAARLFERRKQDVTGEWSHDKQFQLISKEFRSNALLLSLADMLTPALAGRIAPRLYHLLQFYNGSDVSRPAWATRAARMAHDDVQFRQWLLEQIKAADIGIADLKVKQLRQVIRMQRLLFEEMPDDEIQPNPTPKFYRFKFTHDGSDQTFEIPYEGESYGTHKIVDLAPMIYGLLTENSTAVFVDEIGASLHPTLLAALIRQINCGEREKSARGQLVFATHETSLMDDEARNAILRRDQVYFTEKDSSGAARLYSLADFKERQNVNLRKRYLEGRYGAIPALGLFPE